NQVVQAAFCFSDDLKSTVVNPICFSNRLQPQNLPQSAPSPVGEGWREGNKPQGLYWGGEGIRKDCHHSENALSPALPHGGGSGFRQIFRLQAI
ncbi:hypothetical protein, partial [Neisseria gonorrhoeae]|uniref:hypothetical protein n=1 Tax=Neisseria gonorrhoeae TaxID=485 RepID=UPI0027D97068